ncbi:MAG: phosphoribosylglycinamide formyltransferase [Candidatus Krumholzibacteria bacterium]|nr:phosphoribosylglycinamide formyltransferase [Candidatus Krumholzibacteria bacterium]
MNEKKGIAVLASGRGSNFEALARACLDEEYPAVIRALIVDGGEAGAIAIADSFGIERVAVECGAKKGSMTPESSERMAKICAERGVELVCLAGFMRIVGGALMAEYRGRMLNIHPALLPGFKGLHAQEQALAYGVRYSGCTVHFVDEGVDTGPIIIQRVVPVLDGDTVESLSDRILQEEHQAYPEAVRLWAEGRLRIEGRRVRIREKA